MLSPHFGDDRAGPGAQQAVKSAGVDVTPVPQQLLLRRLCGEVTADRAA